MKVAIEARARVLAFDSEMQYGTGRRKNPLPGFTLITQPGELKKFLAMRLGAPFKVVYQPKWKPHLHLISVFALLIEAGECTLAIDEVANYCENGKFKSYGKDLQRSAHGLMELNDYFDYVCRCGRHVGVSLYWTSQRPSDVAAQLRSMTPNLNVFRLEEGGDLSWLQARGMSREQLSQISKLPDRVFFAKDEHNNWRVYPSQK